MLVSKGTELAARRMFSKASESLPVVSIPVYLKDRIKKLQAKQNEKHLKKIRALSMMGNRRVPIITSPEKKELNHYLGRVYDPKKELPLITLGWRNGKYRGHSFTIHKHADHPCVLDPSISSFSVLGLESSIVNLLEKNGFKSPAAIQEDAIPLILKGQNIVCCAETGSGKTLAYLAPLLQLVQRGKKVKGRPSMSPLALVLVPGKELALQISDLFCKMGEECGLNVCSLVSSVNVQTNLRKAREEDETDIVVASIGTFAALAKSGVFSVSYVNHIVVDEADTLLDESFIDCLSSIMKDIIVKERGHSEMAFHEEEEEDDDDDDGNRIERPMGAQLLLIGATLPRRLEDSFGSLVDVSSLVWVKSSHVHRLPPHVTHKFMRMGREEKSAYLSKWVKEEFNKKQPMIIFSNNTMTASWLSHYLNSHDIRNVCFHKEINNKQRRRNFLDFQEGKVDIISCTDLGSRGLDTGRVTRVLNYDFPNHMSDYIHRCGRTGRLGSASTDCHITSFLCAKYEIPLVQQIEAAARRLKPLPNVDANIKQYYQIITSRKKVLEASRH